MPHEFLVSHLLSPVELQLLLSISAKIGYFVLCLFFINFHSGPLFRSKNSIFLTRHTTKFLFSNIQPVVLHEKVICFIYSPVPKAVVILLLGTSRTQAITVAIHSLPRLF
jgi:hypothetical protein